MPTVRVAATFDIGGDTWQFTTGVATADKDWDSQGLAFNTAIIDSLLPLLGSDCTYVGSQWSDYVERETPGGFVPAEADSVGGGGLSLPPEVAATVTLETESYGRGKQGRWFLSGIPQEGYVVGSLETEYRASLQVAIDGLGAALAASNIVVLVVRLNRTVSPPTLTSSDIVSGFNVRTVIRGQRRRQHGRDISGRGGG